MIIGKPGRVVVVCLNCNREFSVSKAEYERRIQNSKLPGLFHTNECRYDYMRKQNRRAGRQPAKQEAQR